MSWPMRIVIALIFSLLVPALLQAGWLGITVGQLVGQDSVMIEEVLKGSPAERAGLRAGDVIHTVDGKLVKETGDLGTLVGKAKAGTGLAMVVQRKGKLTPVEVVLSDPPEDPESLWVDVRKLPPPPIVIQPMTAERQKRGWLGVELLELSKGLKSYFKTDAGVLVSSVMKDSPAEKAGLRAGDVITHADGEQISGIAAIRRIVRAREGGEVLDLQVLRRDRREPVRVTATLDEREAESFFFEFPSGTWSGEFDAEEYTQALQEYRKTLEEHAHNASEMQREKKKQWERRLEDWERSAELLSKEESLRRLAENQRAREQLLAARSLQNQNSDYERQIRDLERQLRDMERQQQRRTIEIERLKQSLAQLERTCRR